MTRTSGRQSNRGRADRRRTAESMAAAWPRHSSGNLLLADVMSEWARSCRRSGPAWLMVSPRRGPDVQYALTQTRPPSRSLSSPCRPARSGTLSDRRKLISAPNSGMLGVADVLAVATIPPASCRPWLLLGLDVCRCQRDAMRQPTWRPSPELVKKQDLAAASALNGIEFNFAELSAPR